MFRILLEEKYTQGYLRGSPRERHPLLSCTLLPPGKRSIQSENAGGNKAVKAFGIVKIWGGPFRRGAHLIQYVCKGRLVRRTNAEMGMGAM